VGGGVTGMLAKRRGQRRRWGSDRGGEHPIFARLYDAYMLPQEFWGVRKRRRRVVSQAVGATLELGVGTGLNLPFYEQVDFLLAIDPNPYMLKRARRRVGRATVRVYLIRGVGEALPFRGASFDTVISTLVFASIPDPYAAAAEVRRVLKPDGRLRFFEHFRSGHPLLSRLQDAVTPLWKRFLGGCQPNRDVVTILRETGFEIQEAIKFRGTFLLHGVARLA
jgi:ubiquinone/menaquinone biosynthesis C-methylase UbiE